MSSNPKAIVLAADHRVYAQRVTSWLQEISVQMATGITVGFARVRVASWASGVGTEVFDVGLLQHVEGTVDCRIAAGIVDFVQRPVMTVRQALEAISVSIEVANTVIDSGADVLVPGGIGFVNTAPTAALTVAFTGRSVVGVTDRGAGANDKMLAHKVAVIGRGLEIDGVTRLITEGDAVDALAAVGGFERAVVTGLILVAAVKRVPMVLDGVASYSAALVARAICPDAVGYLIVGYAGAEPVITAVYEAPGLRRLVDLGLRPGEGPSGTLALPLVRAAASIANEIGTFSGQGVSKARRVLRQS